LSVGGLPRADVTEIYEAFEKNRTTISRLQLAPHIHLDDLRERVIKPQGDEVTGPVDPPIQGHRNSVGVLVHNASSLGPSPLPPPAR
jgi:hypothetical protein